MSLIIATIIIVGTWQLLQQSLNLSLDGVPTHINLKQVEDFLLQQKQIKAVHDLHIWALSSSEIALTAHLVVDEFPQDDSLLHYLSEELEHHFGIHHSTLQIIQQPLKAACY